MVVCEKLEEEEWHKKKCLHGQCISCGVDKFPFCLKESNGSIEALVEWRRFAMEKTTSKVGKSLKKLTLVYKKTFSDEFIVMTFLVRECYGSPEKHENSLKFVKIRAEECFDKVLNEEF
jgi:hypothetical protein